MVLPNAAYAQEEIQFNDVGGTHWAQEEINSMAQLGFIKGYSNNTFKPNKDVTREEFAALITRSFYLELPDDGQAPTFMDVGTTRWSYASIEASKEFLTGFYPPSGKAFFDPVAKATREDVAVALVRTLAYQPDDLQNPRVLSRFYDEDEISPNMRTYVALAVEKKLINGYNDGTFRPGKAVTRAEAAALLYRAIKGAAGDGQQELTLNADAPETVTTQTFYITGDVTKGAKVFINNREAEVVQGQFRVGFRLQEEGTYTYTVTARLAGGKTQSVTKKVTYEKGAPTIEVTGVPETTDKQSITVSWKVKDENDPSPVVYVNGEKQYASATSARISLEDGTNEITVVAENKTGKSAKVVKRVVFQGGGPTLNLLNVPETTDKEQLKVNWTVQDKNDASPKVYLNGELQYGTTATVNLRDGSNTLTFRAVNGMGKTTEVTKTVVLNAGAPVLTVDPLPEVTSKDSVKVSWTVQDKNDASPKVYVNGDQAYGNSWTVSLKPGANTIVVKAVNQMGKATEKTMAVTFANEGPALVVSPLSPVSQSKTLRINWTVTDPNDNAVVVYVNEEKAYGNSANVNLKPGANEIRIKAVNRFGATTEQSYAVAFEPPGPKLTLGYAPESTSSQIITLTWTVSDENDGNPQVYVNDRLVSYNRMDVSLTPGVNTFKLVASNSFGKTTEVVYSVTYAPAP